MSADLKQGKRLGRGLDGLLGAASSMPRSAPVTPPRETFCAAIEELHPIGTQPRTRMDEAKLEELAQSIREMGVLEPILVRKRTAGGFEIIAGERRWRAAQKAGLREVPIVVRELSTRQAFEAALVENLQREDLNPVETARAFQRLIDEHQQSPDTIAKRLGKDRSTIANSLRLLKLPPAVLERIESGELTEGHGRALLGAPSAAVMQKLALAAIANGWSVRETERQVRAAVREVEGSPNGQREGRTTSANVRDLENRLSKSLGTRVTIADRKGKGRIAIAYSSYDELDRLLEKLL
jgi:ParB family chromosome partitioning protein